MTTAGAAWCALCVGYVDHDTAHHDTQGGVKVGDHVTIQDTIDPDLRHLAGKSGRVEQVRGSEVTVAIPGRQGTTTVSIAREHVRA